MNDEQLKLFKQVYTYKGQVWNKFRKRLRVLIELSGRMEIWEIRYNGQEINSSNEVKFKDTDFIKKIDTISAHI